MIEIPLTPKQLVEVTIHLPGIRYKIAKDGNFSAYANGWTLTIDCFKWLRKKLFKFLFNNKWKTLKKNLKAL
jgi:hypothetical protein